MVTNIVCGFLGLLVGLIISEIAIRKCVCGYLKKMDSDDGDPYLFVDLDRHPNEMGKMKYAIFRVDFENKFTRR